MGKHKQLTVHDFAARKGSAQKISMVTCYDYWSATVLNRSDVDCLLVGDSLAMVMHGFESTVHADVDLMALHTRAVRRGAPDKFIVADMPFLSVRKGLERAMDAVQTLIQAGASAVKIEGERGQLDLIAHIVESGVPVMGHLGLTPQAVLGLGGHRVQGRDEAAARELMASARRLADAGCFALVLECVPAKLADCVTRAVPLTTIGIGAGARTDGQVLVLQDLLGTNPDFQPKFLRRYADGFGVVNGAVNQFHADVQSGEFPSRQESYA
ncbi:MAG: 3-methyl-2-oxobutanoate hydroxymethyltransferase [Pseudomonadales bacterium]|nr:3-methyl-2-oxobutanoate hydroxymethyltransferase [Pseudomonadales bacterium]